MARGIVMALLVLPLLLLASVPAHGAAELLLRDLVVRVDLPIETFDFTFDTGSTTIEGEDDFEEAIGVAIGYQHSFTDPGEGQGWVLAGELAFSRMTYNADDQLVEFGIRGAGGYGVAPAHRFWIWGGPYVGFGHSEFDLTVAGSESSYIGWYLEGGGLVQLGYSPTDRLSFALQAGAGVSIHRLRTNNPDRDLDLTNVGGFVGFGITWRFNELPWRLE